MSAALALALLAAQPIAKKGLQIQMVDDALALGVRQAALNVQIGDYVDPKTAHVDEARLAGLDAQIRPLQIAGVRVFLILLARATGNPALDARILHPRFDPASPNRLAAFNVGPDGAPILQAFVRRLQTRYRPAGWIVGNEVDSHHAWFSMGRSTPDEVVDVVERSLRLVRRAGGRPYLSLDHFWTARFMDDPTLAMPGKDVLDGVARLARQRGDFEWHVAHHPYPENLFEPRFWLDATARLDFDTPRVTFQNLEVLTEYLKRPELRWRGRPRRVILSEQGFHRPDGPDGEDVQAAAYAAAWNRVVRNPGIDAFILHRQVDHAQEGGLRLGLWTRRADSIADPGRQTRMWRVFRACGTPHEAAATAFALPIVGVPKWDALAPRPVRYHAGSP